MAHLNFSVKHFQRVAPSISPRWAWKLWSDRSWRRICLPHEGSTKEVVERPGGFCLPTQMDLRITCSEVIVVKKVQ